MSKEKVIIHGGIKEKNIELLMSNFELGRGLIAED